MLVANCRLQVERDEIPGLETRARMDERLESHFIGIKPARRMATNVQPATCNLQRFLREDS